MTAIGAHVTRGHRRYARELELAELKTAIQAEILGYFRIPFEDYRAYREPQALRSSRPARAPLTIPGAITRADWRAMIRAEREQVAHLLTYAPPARELSDEEIAKRAAKAAIRDERKRQLRIRRDIALGDGFRSLGKRKRWYDQHGPRRTVDEVTRS